MEETFSFDGDKNQNLWNESFFSIAFITLLNWLKSFTRWRGQAYVLLEQLVFHRFSHVFLVV